MTEVLFVNPPTPSPPEQAYYGAMAPPLGIGYAAATLREAGFEVAAVDLALAGDAVEELKRAIQLHDPRVIGFYALTQNYFATELLHRVARSIQPDAVTWVGGPHVTYEVEAALRESGFDVVFLFEAERSIVEAAACQLRGRGQLRDVAGIAFLEDGAVYRTAARPREKVLDALPYPARDLFPMHAYARPGTVMSSRGCPLKCIFCIASTFEDAYRYRSPENVVGEVRAMYEAWGVNDFYFIDNVFTTHRPRAREICRLLREADLPVGWYCVSRVDYVSPVLMQDLASAGCYRIELGVESADLGVIDTLRKRITIDQVRRAADVILNLGMQPMFTFQVGHPSDTPDTIATTFDLVHALREMGAGTYLAITTPYPGTPLYLERERYGIRLEAESWEDFRMSNPTYSTDRFSRNDLRRAIYQDAVAMARAIAEGKLQDPHSAPWVRFRPDAPRVELPPPPPREEDQAPLKLEAREAAAPRERVTLPLLQVSR